MEVTRMFENLITMLFRHL